MNYRHIYHAGNFADVFKHVILIMLLERMCQKDKPFLYLDTHAGIGLYDLTSEIGQKTREYENGIAKIFLAENCPEVIEKYKNIVLKFNRDAKGLRYYPGSPLIAQAFLRPQDRMVLCELHPDDVQVLQHQFAHNSQVAVHHTNGYQGIKSFLPPKSGRGLTLIDPPFEEKDEFTKIITAMEIAVKQYSIGIYTIWYPIKNKKHVKNFINKINELDFKNVINYEFSIAPQTDDSGLTSCGMMIVNPPWQFAENFKPIWEWLRKVISK